MDLYYITADFSVSEIIEKKLIQLIDRLRPTQINIVKKKISKLLNRIDKKSDEEKLEYLKLQKLRFSQDRSRLNTTLQRIEEKIIQLNKKLDKKGS